MKSNNEERTKSGWIALSLIILFVAACTLFSAKPASALLPTTTRVSCSPGAVTVGTGSTCTITVAGPGGSIPSGKVDMFTTSGSGSFNETSCSLSGGTCEVDYTPTSTSGSPDSIGATYEGDDAFQPSSSSTNGSVTVNEFSSTVEVVCTPSPVIVGDDAVCTVSVTAYNPSGELSLTSSGSAAVSVPGQCTLSASSCQVTVTTSAVGTVGIQASYPGDANNFAAVSNSFSLTVSPYASSTTVGCSPAALVVGEMTTCTANVIGYMPTGTILWSTTGTGTFSSNPCNLVKASCTVTYTPATSGSIAATYSGDQNNLRSEGTFSLAANVKQSIQIVVENSAPVANVTLSGCSVSPTSVLANGVAVTVSATSGCSPITATLPPPEANSRYLTSTGASSMPIANCLTSPCQAFSATIYYQVQNTYQVSPESPAAWSSPGSIQVKGTALGSSGQTVCEISVTTGSGSFSCQGWTDYNTQAVLGGFQVSPRERWATGQNTFTDTTGGNTHSSNYYSQVLEYFEYSLVGSTSAPTAPSLNYTSFGASSSFPLIGSSSSLWLDSGSGWSVPAGLSGSTASERWESTVTSGAATEGQTVSLVYYHQYFVEFGYQVSGGGTRYAPPTVSFTSFGAPGSAVQSWVDAGSSFSYTNPLSGSTSIERWATPAPTGVVSESGAINELYYHQYAFALNFTVSGGGTYTDPRFTYVSFGTPGLEEFNATSGTFWVDAGTNWAATPLLPSSSPTEQWITAQTSSGMATAPLTAEFTYYHQYRATLDYSIEGTGGSPPVPSLSYTSVGISRVSQLNKTASLVWMDSSSLWTVPAAMPGVHGERWLSNVTNSVSAAAPFQSDIQYVHQFFVEVGVSTPEGGHVANADQWKDQGSNEVLKATASTLWKLAYWQGATSFSYNGTTALPTLTVLGPANETAIFYPSLTIFTGNLGTVTYSFGSMSGTVPAGRNTTIYPPPGGNVTLTALPNTVVIMFAGWTGSMKGTQLQSSLAIDYPAQVRANFATDYADIGTLTLAALAIFIAAAYVLVIRRGFAPRIRPG